MVGGPDVSVKIASVDKDASFNIYESWSYLLKNYLTIILVATTVWLLVIGVRFSITIGSDLLFGDFKELYEPKVNTDLVTTITINDVVPYGMMLNNQEASEQDVSAVRDTNNLSQATYIIFIVLILSGVIRGLLLHIPSWRSSGGDGMAQSLENYHDTYEYKDGDENFPRYQKSTFIQAFRRSILTSLTVGCGGSGGIEAPVVPMGECIGAGWSKILRINRPDDLRIFQMAGISAAVTTLLDAPLTSALFAAEIVYNARILYRPLMYSLIGSMVAFALNNHFDFFEPLFKPVALTHQYSVVEYMEISVVALLCSAPASLGITLLFRKLEKMIKPFPQLLKPVIGAIGTAFVGLGIWYAFGLEPQHVLGVSEDTIIQVMSGQGNPLLKVWWALLVLVVAKAFATGFTLMAGGSAGRLVPAMYLGGISGAAIYYLLAAIGYHTDANTAVFVVAGLASALVAVVQVPLAAIALVMEVFGTNYGPPAIVSCVLTYLLARRWQLYAQSN